MFDAGSDVPEEEPEEVPRRAFGNEALRLLRHAAGQHQPAGEKGGGKRDKGQRCPQRPQAAPVGQECGASRRSKGSVLSQGQLCKSWIYWLAKNIG